MIDIFNNKYQILNRYNNIITYFIMFLIITFLIILNIVFNYEYSDFNSYVGIIDNDYKLEIYVSEEDVSSLNSYSLFIEEKEYKFEVEEISSEYYFVDNKKCNRVKLNAILDNKLLIKNNILEVIFRKNKTTIYKKIKEELKEWIN